MAFVVLLTATELALLLLLLLSLGTTVNGFVLTTEQIDELYSQLLNLPSGEEQTGIRANGIPKGELKCQAELALFYDVSRDLLLSLKSAVKLSKVQEKLIEEKQWQFDGLAERIKAKEWPAEVGKCKLWKFWHNLEHFAAEQKLIGRGEHEQSMSDDGHQITLNLIECEKIEQILSKNENEIGDEKSVGRAIKRYLEDTKIATHFNSLMGLMTPLKIGGAEDSAEQQFWYHDFVKFFEPKKLKFESNVAYQLRRMRIENDVQPILEFKTAVEQLIGAELLQKMESRQPFLMALDLQSDAKKAEDYLLILATDPKIASIGELRISSRIYFGRILTIFERVYAVERTHAHEHNEKMREIILEIKKKWEENNAKIFANLWRLKEPREFMDIFEFWLNLALLYNKMPLLESDEKIPRVGEIAKNWDKSHSKTLRSAAVRMELVDDHARNVIALHDQFLREHLQRSLFEGGGALIRLKKLLCPTLAENANFFDQLTQKHPELKEIFRIRLNIAQLIQLQIENYITFFDINSGTKEWRQAQFLLDALTYYQWFKQHQSKGVGEGQQKMLEENCAKMEMSMDSAKMWGANLEQLEQIRWKFLQEMHEIWRQNFPDEKTMVSGIEVVATNGRENVLHSVFSLHEKSLGTLILVNEFRQKLKEIYIDSERIGSKLHENSGVFFAIFEMCRGVLHTDDDKKWYGLLKRYEPLLLQNASVPMSEWEKQMFNVDMYTFKHEMLLADQMEFALSLLNGGGGGKREAPQFGSIVGQAAADLANLGRAQNEADEGKTGRRKLTKLCRYESFSSWLTNNGTLLRSSAKWRKFLLRRRFIAQDKIAQCVPSESDLRWAEANCEDIGEQKVLPESNHLEQWELHFILVNDLFKLFPKFKQHFVANVLSLPKFANFATFGADKQIELYTAILGSDDEKTMRELETKLTMKRLIEKANEGEEKLSKNPKNPEEIQSAKAESFAMAALADIFCASDEWPMERMLCPILYYADFLREKAKNQQKINWHSPLACFSHDANVIFVLQRQFLMEDRFEFLKKYLKTEKNDKEDEIVRILREKAGSITRLQNLIGIKSVIALWEEEDIREKLLNDRFFSDKRRLLANYRRAMAKSSSDVERLSGRLAADIAVFMDHLWAEFIAGRKKHRCPAAYPSASSPPASASCPPSSSTSAHSSLSSSSAASFSELFAFVWMDFRILSDLCDPPLHADYSFSYNRLSLYLTNYFTGFFEFLQNERKKRSTNALKNWKGREHSVSTVADMEWLEKGETKVAEPLQMVQQIHFETLQKHMDDAKIGREMREIFLDCADFVQIGTFVLPLSAAAEANKNCAANNQPKKFIRKNLLQFLRMEDIKKLFKMNGVTFSERDFAMMAPNESGENGGKSGEKAKTERKKWQRKETKRAKRKMGKRKQKEGDSKKEDKAEANLNDNNDKADKLEANLSDNDDKKNGETTMDDLMGDDHENGGQNGDTKQENASKFEDILDSSSKSATEVGPDKAKAEKGGQSTEERSQSVSIHSLAQNPMAFVQKYSNFIAIICAAEQKNAYEKFCDFVQGEILSSKLTRLMDEIGTKNSKGEIEIGLMESEVSGGGQTLRIVDEFVLKTFSINFGKVWLLALQSPVSEKGKLVELLRNFDSEMKREYLLRLNAADGSQGEKSADFHSFRADVHSTVVKKWLLMDLLEEGIF